MARSRNIKPSFFLNEELGDLCPLVRLLFIGLWTLADREGRLEFRPKRIKAQIMPYDEINISDAVIQLHQSGFVRVYGEEAQYIQILKFKEHQSPHMKEAKSTLPDPSEFKACTETALEKHQTSTVQAPDEHHKSRPDSLNLIPLTLNPYCDPDGSLVKTPQSEVSPGPDRCPHREIIALYHEILPELQSVNVALWNGEREKHLQTRWRAHPAHQDLDFWREFFETVRTNPHWMGENDRGWRADLGWLVKPANFAKVVERGMSEVRRHG